MGDYDAQGASVSARIVLAVAEIEELVDHCARGLFALGLKSRNAGGLATNVESAPTDREEKKQEDMIACGWRP